MSVPDNLGLGSGGVDHAAELDLGVLLDLHAGSGLETGDLDFRGWHCEERDAEMNYRRFERIFGLESKNGN